MIYTGIIQKNTIKNIEPPLNFLSLCTEKSKVGPFGGGLLPPPVPHATVAVTVNLHGGI